MAQRGKVYSSGCAFKICAQVCGLEPARTMEYGKEGVFDTDYTGSRDKVATSTSIVALWHGSTSYTIPMTFVLPRLWHVSQDLTYTSDAPMRMPYPRVLPSVSRTVLFPRIRYTHAIDVTLQGSLKCNGRGCITAYDFYNVYDEGVGCITCLPAKMNVCLRRTHPDNEVLSRGISAMARAAVGDQPFVAISEPTYRPVVPTYLSRQLSVR